MGGGARQRQREHCTCPAELDVVACTNIMQVKADRSETNTSAKDNIKKLQEETAKVAGKQ